MADEVEVKLSEEEQFIVDRDKAIWLSAEYLEWQPFYEFCVENDLQIPIACPREKMAMVVFSQYTLAKQKGNSLTAGQCVLLLRGRGFAISDDETCLINKNENDRLVIIPDCLKIKLQGETNGGVTGSGNGEVGSSLGTAGNSPDSLVSGDSAGTRVIRNQGTPLPVRRTDGKTKRPDRLP